MPAITSIAEFDDALKSGPYAWPGGYPMFFIMADGEPLSFQAAVAEQARIREGMADNDKQWTPIGFGVNWEDQTLICAHTNKPIECAYPKED